MASFPGYKYSGEITVTEASGFRQGYLDLPFDVPDGVGALRLRLRVSPRLVRGVPNLVTLGLFDPYGFRGNAHRNPPDRDVYLSARGATPGFVQGPIHPGAWLAQLALHAVLADDASCNYTLHIELLADILETGLNINPLFGQTPSISSQQPSVGLPAWYRGELHTHTLHSDGRISPDELVKLAHQNRLDFLAVTDHNTVTALPELDPQKLEGLVLIPGIELTSFAGHALTLGVERWIDWRVGYRDWTMEDAARAVHAAGGLFILAHPGDVPSPVCTGCRWDYDGFDLDLVDGIEIWNGPWRGSNDKNPKSLQYWRNLQTGLRRLPATAGADFHGKEDWGGFMPLTFIYADSPTTPALLEGLRRGRVIVTSGPWLSLEASCGGKEAGIGDELPCPTGLVKIEAGWRDAPPGARLELCNSSGVVQSNPAAGNGSVTLMLPVGASEPIWLELYSEDGSLLAFANPAYIDVRS